MDSLTQFVLGAAVGEITLGKKIGNRAILWGGIAGTIPDLDVMGNFVMDEMDALAFHRGITHSFLFAFVAPAAFAWLTSRYYNSGLYRNKWYKRSAFILWFLLYLILAAGINYLPYNTRGAPNIPLLAVSIAVGLLIFLTLWRRYLMSSLEDVSASWKEWYSLFFWAIFTHPLLDSCTVFGTQLFQPFWDYRVAFNNIAVVDPIYTVPFLICLIIAGWMTRNSPKRRLFTYLGVGISSLYLLFTVYNKWHIDQIFEKSFDKHEISYSRYMTSPSIFNNILWSGIAEGDTAFYQGFYGLLDEKDEVTFFNVLPKNHELLQGHHDAEDIRILKWFSKEYYNVIKRPDGTLQLNDLRFGLRDPVYKSEKDFIFRFILYMEDGEMKARQTRDADDVSAESFNSFWKRVFGEVPDPPASAEISR